MKIEEVIKALLRKTTDNGATEEEANAALAKAEELARKHAIDLASINPDEQEIYLTKESVWEGSRIQHERIAAISVCMAYFNVSCIRTRKWVMGKGIVHSVDFVGTPIDISIASYVYSFLSREFGKRMSPKRVAYEHRRAFAVGMVNVVLDKLHAQRKLHTNQEGLLVLDTMKNKRDEWIEKNTNTTDAKVKKEELDARAYYAGVAAAADIEINNGIAAGKAGAERMIGNGTR